MHRPFLAAGLILAIGCGTPASATVITDAAGDFLTGYVGPTNGDLDVLGTSATISGGNLVLGAHLAAAVGTTATLQYVWGINRGAGTARFSPNISNIDLSKVLFDSVVSIVITNGLLSTAAVNLISPTTIPQSLALGNVSFSGDDITVTVPLSLLPSNGLDASRYGINLWPRLPGGLFTNISDFAPDNGVFVVPEPMSAALLGTGLLGLMGLRRRRR